MSDLPVNIDATYADDGGDPSVKLHQQHHDAIHALYNALAGASPGAAVVDKMAIGTATVNDELVVVDGIFDGTGTSGVPFPLIRFKGVQTTGGDANTVPVVLMVEGDQTGGTNNHSIAVLGYIVNDVTGNFYGVEGRVDLSVNNGAGYGVLGLATLNAAGGNPNSVVNGVRARAEVGPAGTAGQGVAIGLYATATGGAINQSAIFGEGAVSGDNAFVVVKGYITDGAGPGEVFIRVDDTYDAFVIDVSDSQIDSLRVKLRDAAAASKFAVVDSAEVEVFSADSDGQVRANGKKVNRVAISGFHDVCNNYNRQSFRFGVAGTDSARAVVMPFPGSIVGLSLAAAAARTSGSTTWEVYKNGSATGVTAVIDATNTQYNYTTQADSLDTFVAGDRIDIRHVDSTFQPVDTGIEAVVFVQYDH